MRPFGKHIEGRQALVNGMKNVFASDEKAILSELENTLDPFLPKGLKVVINARRHAVASALNDDAINALMLIQCESNVYTTGIARNVSKIAQVQRVYELSGQFDIEALLSGNSMNEINEILEQIRAIRGIRNTCTRFIFKKHKEK